MPVYEYACEKCGHEFEASQRITDEPIKVCPKCRARRVKRLISQTSFVLKGSGWYSDLYSSKGKDKKEKPDSDSSSDTTSTSAATSESQSDDTSSKPKDTSKGKGKGKGKKSSKAAA
ncbi:MAG TPA: zinc ribbon domain-containing protein [Myxococcota bacterium]|nr:zinc ribbon domain-containing protein [Myxococcota bacterium]